MLVSSMGLSVAKILKRIPKDRLRDITRTALILRRLSEEEMLRQGLAWIDKALWLASQNELLDSLELRRTSKN